MEKLNSTYNLQFLLNNMKNLQKLLKRFVQFCLLFPVLFILKFNWTLYFSPNCERNINLDVLNQLNHLEKGIKKDEVDFKMQNFFPEGYFFTNVLYGLAWADLIESVDKKNPIFQRGVLEIEYSIAKLNSVEGKAIFSPKSPLPYGAFYNGWLTYLVGNYIEAVGEKNATPQLLSYFKTQCADISQAISKTNLPYLESYQGQAWPADNVLCLASLSLHDKVLPPQYKAVISTWIKRIKLFLDKETGMIPHCFSLYDSVGMQGVRGSSQSLMHCFLPDIDSAFAQEQFALYRQNFIQNKIGLPAVREYAINTEGLGDVDSGPIIWDVGTAASVVAIKAMAENHEYALYIPIRNTIEAFGFPINMFESKFYLGNQLPVADAFIAWCNAKNCGYESIKIGWWRWQFQLISLLIVVPFCWWIYRL
jgi:hypothetical protein